MPEIFDAPQSTQHIEQTILDSIALGESFQQTLEKACVHIESALGNVICCVMLLDETSNTLNVVAGPSLSAEVIAGLNGLVPGPKAASCGTAAFTGKPVIAEDTTVSPYWADFQDNVKKYGIGSCWSYPILSVGGSPSLGTFAICHSHPAKPDAEQLRLLATASQLAAIAIQRQRADQTIRQTQNALVEIARDVSGEVGRGFLRKLVLRLSATLDVEFAMVSEVVDREKMTAQFIAFAVDGEIAENFEYDLSVTPCAITYKRDFYYCPRDLPKLFPGDQMAIDWGVEGYVGLNLKDTTGESLGWMAVFSRKPIELTAAFEAVLRSFAVRATVELARSRTDSILRQSEERFRTLYDSTPVMMHSIDRHGRIVSVNQHWLTTLGYERDEVIGQLSTRFLTESSARTAERVWLPRLFAGETCENFPFDLVTKDGQVINALLTASLERGDQSVDDCGHAIMRDVTKQRETEAEVDRLNAALENALAGIARLDKDGNYVMVRAGYAKTLGYEADELIGQSWEMTVPHDHREKTRQAAVQMSLHGKVEVENVGIRKDGSLFYKQCLLVRSNDNRGEYDGFYCFMNNITKRVEAEQNREALEEQLRQSQKLDAVGTLASGIAHDINNTLTAVFGFAEQARNQIESPEVAARSIEMIERAAEQASSVTKSILTFAQKGSAKKEAIQLDAMVTESMRMLRRLLPASIALQEDVAATTPIWIDADTNQIQQILMNLTINARDAIVGQGELRVDVSVQGNEAMLIVEDTGTGMSEEVRQRVFEPFFTTKERGQGTGLGLSVVHGIIRDHGGRAEVSSTEGHGTRFEIFFPIVSENRIAKDATSHPKWSTNKNGQNKRILVAEDDEYVGAVLRSSLENEGYDVILARTGDDAIAAFEQHREDADMAILDLDLPGKSGEECSQYIQNQRADLPILIVTGNADAYLSRHRTGGHADTEPFSNGERLLTKPFKMNHLIGEIRSMLDISVD